MLERNGTSPKVEMRKQKPTKLFLVFGYKQRQLWKSSDNNFERRRVCEYHKPDTVYSSDYTQ